ncbi:hypothetical protein RB614_19270 [Phytohabitans sp. ZYX-F-186]|uniref:YbaB/EbfC DNA-binding family protein n=1 Tax=Phytohabitans maris TaxID=3071409 RepID=A0ABU0ZHY7_9ACTN|nr:hypothetical protein [Phytohabitans sp. ZYX-F-186]MDQ7906659.1 hypothetical protein [Phytohabitans sp. ZYX-F-186]
MSGEDSARLLAELAELHAQAEALATRLSAPIDPRFRHSGGDRLDLAQVTVDSSGRATDVVVSREWRRQTDAAGLAQALVEAAAEAQRRRLEAWASGGEHAQTQPDATLLDRATPPGDGPLDLSGPDLVHDLLSLLDRAEGQLDEARHQLESHFAGQSTLSSPGGELTIATQGGQVSAIEFDERWIAPAGAEEVARHVCRLLQDAHDRAWTGIGDLLPRELSDLMSFTADPERMLRQLGFRT